MLSQITVISFRNYYAGELEDGLSVAAKMMIAYFFFQDDVVILHFAGLLAHLVDLLL